MFYYFLYLKLFFCCTVKKIKNLLHNVLFGCFLSIQIPNKYVQFCSHYELTIFFANRHKIDSDTNTSLLQKSSLTFPVYSHKLQNFWARWDFVVSIVLELYFSTN